MTLRRLAVAAVLTLTALATTAGRTDHAPRIEAPAQPPHITPGPDPYADPLVEAVAVRTGEVMRALDDTARSVAAWVAHVAALERVRSAPVITSPVGGVGLLVAPSTGGGTGECTNPVVPDAVARRESGCTWDATNASGCDGHGCTGFFQIHGGHYMDPSPWGGRGACVGLDRWDRDAQIECATRLGPGAWG